jgi:hypothetical protein
MSYKIITDISPELLNQYAKLIKERWDDNAVEALIGLMSTIISSRQLEVLIEDLTNELEELV